MFWGLIVRHDKQYSHKVETRFHVSMASLDVSTTGKSPIELMVTVGGESYMLCRLSKEHPQQPLDLNFSDGEDIVFFSRNGEGNIHMTGYNLDDDEFDEFGDESEEESEEEEKIDTPKSAKRKQNEASPESKRMKVEAASKKKVEELEDSDDDVSDLEMDEFSDDDDMEDLKVDSDEESEESSEGKSITIQVDGRLERIVSEGKSMDELKDVSNQSSEEEETPMKKGKTPQKQKQTPVPGSGKKNKKAAVLTPQSAPKEQAPKYTGTPYPGKGKESKPETPMTNGTESEKKKKKKNKKNKNKKDSMGASPALDQPKFQKKFIKGGVSLEDMKAGTGPDAAKGKFVQIYYEGRLKDSGKVFDSNKEGKGFKFKLGAGEVIKGMDLGLDGMKVGGRRKLTIPPKMGYGHQGAGKDIPPNSTLEFDIELKAVN